MKKVVLTLKDISFSNNNNLILENLSLDIEQNTLTTIIGKSGSGKSTLVKIMAGLIIPTKGTLTMWGQDYYQISDKEKVDIRKRISFVFQNAALISNLSIKENLILPLNFHYPEMEKKEQGELVERMLEQVGMLKAINGRPAQLSIGEQKLVAIARALITKPELLFLDEPLGSLDATITRKLMDIIYMYSKHDWTTVVIVTYSKEIITGICNRIMFLKDHKIKFNMPKNKVLSLPENEMPDIITNMLNKYEFEEESEL